MPVLTEEGTYSVSIVNIEVYDDLNFEGDPDAFKICFWGETPDGFTGRADLIFSKKTFYDNRQKRNVSSSERSQKILEACGIPDGNVQYLPRVLSGEIKMECVFTVKKNGEYTNCYLNPPRRGTKIDSVDMGSLAARFDRLMGKQTAQPAPPPFPVDDNKEAVDSGFDPDDSSADDTPF